MTRPAFDSLAARYDELWTHAPVGRHQRNAVWERMDTQFHPGDTVLDLGCGTGADALHLMDAGVHVRAIDASPEMVRLARNRGVDARPLAIENLVRLDASFDGALSNFGVLNCIEDLPRFGAALAPLVRPRGRVVLCVMGRFCLWETLHYLGRRDLAKACRRFRGRSAPSSLGVRVFYPSVSQLAAALRPSFRLVEWRGIGLCVPPSYITSLPAAHLHRLAALDRLFAHRSILRGLADHRLLIFERV